MTFKTSIRLHQPLLALILLSAAGAELAPEAKEHAILRGDLKASQFRFEKGKTGAVEISNAGADGYVIVDAVQFLKK